MFLNYQLLRRLRFEKKLLRRKNTFLSHYSERRECTERIKDVNVLWREEEEEEEASKRQGGKYKGEIDVFSRNKLAIRSGEIDRLLYIIE